MKALLTILSVLLLMALAIGSYGVPPWKMPTNEQSPLHTDSAAQNSEINQQHTELENQVRTDFVQLQVKITPEMLARANEIYAAAIARGAAAALPPEKTISPPKADSNAAEISRLTAENKRLFDAIQRTNP